MNSTKRIIRSVNTEGLTVKTHVQIVKFPDLNPKKEDDEGVLAIIITSIHLRPIDTSEKRKEFYARHRILKTFKGMELLSQEVAYKAETFIDIYDAVYDIFEKVNDAAEENKKNDNLTKESNDKED